MNKYGIIMAGGGGTRFWPLSRRETPKQLLNLSGKALMINETIERIHSIIDYKDIFIVTNKNQGAKMKSAVQNVIGESNILLEPEARNTAACIGYAAIEMLEKYGDGIMCIFPADHYIKDEVEFLKILKKAISVAEIQNELVTIGIRPTFPSTGYGYIRFKDVENNVEKSVEKFVEKPDQKLAIDYVKSGNYVWNSGMFIWKASVIMEEFKKYLPDIYKYLLIIQSHLGKEDEKDVLERVYPCIPKISIDYGIMERSKNVVVIPGEFGWNDVGSWDTLEALHQKDDHGNVVIGKYVGIDTKKSVLYSKERMIATIGIEDLVIVDTEDVILVADKSRSQEVKKIVEQLEECRNTEYL